MDGSSWLPYVLPNRAAYFDPLCERLGLVRLPTHSLESFGFASAEGGTVRVLFEHDRGICYLALGPHGENDSLCSVEEMAARFPRARVMAEGFQRLSLAEQTEFLMAHWTDLQVMFSPEHLAETRKWRKAAGAAYMKKFTRSTES